MFEARVCIKVEGDNSTHVCDFDMLKKFIPSLVDARVLVESGSSETRGSKCLTLHVYGHPLMGLTGVRSNRYCARYVPLTSRPKQN